MSSPQHANVAITYANDLHTDGAGAQLQRVLGVFADPRLLHIPYLHSPLWQLGTGSADAGRYNALFDLPDDLTLPEVHRTEVLEQVEVRGLLETVVAAREAESFLLLRILYPYGITDAHPEAYEAVAGFSPFERSNSGPLRVALHVRRGDLAPENPRYLPDDFYVRAAQLVVNALEKLGVDYQIELVAGGPASAAVPRAEDDPTLGGVAGFDVLPKLSRFVDGDPVEALRRLATADILVMSRSSFSYVAGLLDPVGIAVVPPSHHTPLPDWIQASGDGSFAEEELLGKLRT